MKPYENLRAWQHCHRLVLEIYAVTARFPPDERFALTSQLRRAAYSTAANIAEGSAKHGVREFPRYVNMSLGSLGELSYALRLAKDLDYITPNEWDDLEALRDEANRTAWGLHGALKKTAVAAGS